MNFNNQCFVLTSLHRFWISFRSLLIYYQTMKWPVNTNTPTVFWLLTKRYVHCKKWKGHFNPCVIAVWHKMFTQLQLSQVGVSLLTKTHYKPILGKAHSNGEKLYAINCTLGCLVAMVIYHCTLSSTPWINLICTSCITNKYCITPLICISCITKYCAVFHPSSYLYCTSVFANCSQSSSFIPFCLLLTSSFVRALCWV